MVWRPARRNGRAQRWARVTAEPRAPLAGSRMGGSTSRTWRSPAGAPFRSISSAWPTRQHRGEFARVPDGGRAADDDRLAAVVGADPEEATKDVGDVAAEYPAIRVQLVDDDDLELLEQLEPLGVVREDRRMEHVRVGDDDLAGGADRPSGWAPGCRRRRSTSRIDRPAAADSSPNSVTWSWPSALVGNRKRARDAGSSTIAWSTGTA